MSVVALLTSFLPTERMKLNLKRYFSNVNKQNKLRQKYKRKGIINRYFYILRVYSNLHTTLLATYNQWCACQILCLDNRLYLIIS